LIEAVTLTREQLHELVWTEPMRDLAKRFHISDVGLKKVCIRNRIPVPLQGHWQKVRAGRQSPRIPLPVLKHPQTITFKSRPAAATADAEPPPPDPAVEAEKEFRPVAVAEALARPHPVTSAMREELARKNPDDYGAIHCVEPDVMSARIHPASKGRLLRIADALLKGFERRGFELRPGKPGLRIASALQVIVDEEAYSISIEERMRRETHKPTPDELSRKRRGLYVYMKSYDYAPTGEFMLKIEPCYGSGIQSSWRDTRHHRIEQRLTEVMVSLRRHAALRKVERARAQRRAARFEAEQGRRSELRDQVEAEREAMAKLESDFEAWNRAERIRAFVDVVQTHPAHRSDPGLRAWASWARECADRIDPLKDAPPSVLDTPEADMRPISLWQFEDDEE
jgi:hypothetical protein